MQYSKTSIAVNSSS